MSYWSNIQASRIHWGSDWKNLWIPNYKKIYTKYFISDYVTFRYIKVKFFGDDKINRTFMYYYDFFLQKTYDMTLLYLKKYNVDFARLSQAGYVGKLLYLKDLLASYESISFHISTMGAQAIANYGYRPHVYYYFNLLNYYTDNFNTFNLRNSTSDDFNEDKINILEGLSSYFFVTKNVFSTKSNFFGLDDFSEIQYFHYTFISHNISHHKADILTPNLVRSDRFRLANFLFNPTILNKYPNFTFYYNSWLHKSWQLSKRWTIESLKLFQCKYEHAPPIIQGINYFFSKYIRLFFLMREINVFLRNSTEAGVGITQEFIAKQVRILHFKLQLSELMAFRIKEIWFYLKAYLKYFSYEGKINLNQSWIVFKKLFFLKKLIWITCSGQQLNTPSLISFLKVFYISAIDRNLLQFLLSYFYSDKNFLKNWYLTFSKFYLKTIFLLKKILRFWKLNIILKILIISFLSNNFLNWIQDLAQINFFVNTKFLDESSRKFYIDLPMNINTLFIFFLFFSKYKLKRFRSKRKKKKNIFFLLHQTTSFLMNNSFCIVHSKSKKPILNFYDKLIDAKQTIKHSDWFALVGFHPQLVITYLQFSMFRKLIWRKKFIYFYYALSNLTPKLFFWILMDLGNLTHFSILLHFLIIYWQNFFFFYVFILKCLKKMYTHCSPENLMNLTRPIWMFLQKSNIFITTLDLFSSSFRAFLVLGLSCFEENFESGNQKLAVTLGDFAAWAVNFGKANCWLNTTENKFLLFNKFSYNYETTLSPFFMPFFSMWIASKVFFRKNSIFVYEKKNWIDVSEPYFATRIPTHLVVDYYSNLHLSATLIAIFVKKKLERDHLLAEILRSLNILLSQADMIKGFMFLLKGRFSRRERATKIWLKKGKLDQVNVWTKLDYCKKLITLKYGSVSVRIWLLLTNTLNDVRAMI